MVVYCRQKQKESMKKDQNRGSAEPGLKSLLTKDADDLRRQLLGQPPSEEENVNNIKGCSLFLGCFGSDQI